MKRQWISDLVFVASIILVGWQMLTSPYAPELFAGLTIAVIWQQVDVIFDYFRGIKN